MRIAMVSEHASPLAVLGGVDAGGQNVHVAALATELGRMGNEVTVYTRRDKTDLPKRVRFAEGVVVEHVDAGPPQEIPKDELLLYMDEFASYLGRTWTRSRPDLVHTHFWMSGKAGLDAATPIGIPVVHTFHALGVVKRRQQGAKDTSPPERLGEEVRILRCADAIISTCSDEVFELRHLDSGAARISIVPCGVDLKMFYPDGPTETRSIGRHRVVVLTRLVERKGVGNVITALQHLPHSELVIGGGPDPAELWNDAEARRLRALARALGVWKAVDMRGRIPRESVPPLLRSADVVVCVPWYEPFGIVPLEAMACGVPVVASAVGGMIDSVVDGVTGVHVPPRRPDVLAAALHNLLPDAATRRLFGRNGAVRAQTRYGWERIATSTLEVYRQVLARSSTRRVGVLNR